MKETWGGALQRNAFGGGHFFVAYAAVVTLRENSEAYAKEWGRM